jgi:hypothetical protein
VGSRAHISTVTLRFSPSFGSSPVNFALANSKAATAALAGPPSEVRSVSGIRRNRWTLPPKLVGLSPEHVRLGGIAHNAGATGDRQVSFVFRIDEDKADDIGRGFDLILLCTVDVGHEKDQAGVAVGPFAQSAGELRCQHAHPGLFNDVPDAVDVVLLAHVNAYVRRNTPRRRSHQFPEA